jgi:hypothetical protein
MPLASHASSAAILIFLVVIVSSINRPNDIPAAQASSTTIKGPTKSLPIIPGLSGFGSNTTAGSGRHLKQARTRIYKIRTLSDSGSGSLRECISLNEPRTCLFEISGEIKLKSILKIKSPFITIAGQTAPQPGITITQGGFSIETHDVLIQHLAVRPGDSLMGIEPRFRDGISIGAPSPKSVYNIVLDHLSVTWAIDENVSTAYPNTHDVTIANSIIAEGLHNSIHPKGPHSKGVMIGNFSKRITLRNNLISSNEERNPYIKPGTTVEMINNTIYGWGDRGAWSLCNLTNNDGTADPVQLSFIGNYYIPGPWSFVAPPLYANILAITSRIYVEDNELAGDSTHASPWSITKLDEESFRAEAPPVSSGATNAIPFHPAYITLLKTVGSRPCNRSPIDQRIVSDVINRNGSIKDCVSGCSRAAGPKLSLPVKIRPLRLPRNPMLDKNRDGYTNLENWLQRFNLSAATCTNHRI